MPDRRIFFLVIPLYPDPMPFCNPKVTLFECAGKPELVGLA